MVATVEINYNTSLPVGDDINDGRPCTIIHFDPKTYEVKGEEHYNMENVKVPKHAIESLARGFLPAIQAFYQTEEGKQVMEQLASEKEDQPGKRKSSKQK